ncbi:hypothetical protein ACWD4L_23470 [Streptomyces sp. NPDC002596]
MAYSPNPHINTPLTAARPRMYGSSLARVIWTLVPLVSISLLAAVPFITAAAKGVIKPWMAAVYGRRRGRHPRRLHCHLRQRPEELGRAAAHLLISIPATHTALLDSEKTHIGK